MKLILGGAQLGLSYGITNKNSFSFDNSIKILDQALKSGFTEIDLAYNYGKSHEIINEFGVNKFKIHTKLPSIKNIDNINKIIDELFESIDCQKIEVLYLHDSTDLKLDSFEKILKKLIEIQKNGLVKKIGVSIYDEDENIKYFDVIQCPLNITNTKDFHSLRNNFLNSEIYGRSIFLQGILTGINIPNDFMNRFELYKWFEFLKSEEVNPLELALASVINSKPNGIVVGFNNATQVIEFSELLNNLNLDLHKKLLDSNVFSRYVKNINILKDPRKW